MSGVVTRSRYDNIKNAIACEQTSLPDRAGLRVTSTS